MAVLRFARASHKHRIGQARCRYLIEHSRTVLRKPPPVGAPAGLTDRLLYLGDDEAGIPLEVMAVELAEGALLVIDAMPLRSKYRKAYDEVQL